MLSTNSTNMSPYFPCFSKYSPIEDLRRIDSAPLDELVESLVVEPKLDEFFDNNPEDWRRLLGRAADEARNAYGAGNDDSKLSVQKSLFHIYNQFVAEPSPENTINQFSPYILRLKSVFENEWLGFERQRIPDIDSSKTENVDVGDAIKLIMKAHGSSDHPLFRFLETEASKGQIAQYFVCGYALTVRYYDLMALSLVGIDPLIRPEVSTNFWDEMGNGDFQNSHLSLYSDVLEHVNIEATPEEIVSRMSWQSFAGYNLLLGHVLHRSRYFQSLGAMAVAELADPAQYERLLAGCDRAGIRSPQSKNLAYYEEHAEVDCIHGQGWLDNVISPIVQKHPEAKGKILEGCYMRMNTAADYWGDVLDTLKAMERTA